MGCRHLGNRDRLRCHRSLCMPLDGRFHKTLLFNEVAMKKWLLVLMLFLPAMTAIFSRPADSADTSIAHAVFYVG